MRKKLTLIFTVSIFCFQVYPQQFQWAAGMGGPGYDAANDVAVDAAGNVFTTGFFIDSADFDPGAGVSMIYGTGILRDVFVAKTNADGTFGWAVSFAGPRSDEGLSLATDASGNVYVTGYFRDTVDFDPGAGVLNLIANDTLHWNDIFVCKLTNNGQLLWAKNFGSNYDEAAYAMDVDASGNIYLTGAMQLTTDFDPGPVIFNLTSAGALDIFVARFDTNGNFVWAKRMGGSSSDRGSGITIDASGNVLITGRFRDVVDFNPGAGTYNLTAPPYYFDSFICKLSSDGDFVWAKQISGPNEEEGAAIATDAAGNVFITGHFIDSADFDPGAGTYMMYPQTGTVYICRLDPDGDLVWAKHIGGHSLSDRPLAIAVDAASNVYTAGTYVAGGSDFDPGPGVQDMPYDTGSTIFYPTLFISKLDADGDFVFAKAAYQGGQRPGDIIVDASGSTIWVGGFYNDTCDFDPDAPVHNLYPYGNHNGDIFVLKLGPATGINETPAEGRYQVFPNPTSGLLQIDLGETLTSVALSLRNSTGQLVQINNFKNADLLMLNITQQPAGLYFAEIQTERGIKTLKVLKE